MEQQQQQQQLHAEGPPKSLPPLPPHHCQRHPIECFQLFHQQSLVLLRWSAVHSVEGLAQASAPAAQLLAVEQSHSQMTGVFALVAKLSDTLDRNHCAVVVRIAIAPGEDGSCSRWNCLLASPEYPHSLSSKQVFLRLHMIVVALQLCLHVLAESDSLQPSSQHLMEAGQQGLVWAAPFEHLRC